MDADPDTLSNLANATVEKSLYCETLPDLARVQARPAKGEAGCAGWDAEAADLAEGVEYFLCNTITEVFLVAFRAQIGEWQDRDRADFPLSLLATLRLCFCVGD